MQKVPKCSRPFGACYELQNGDWLEFRRLCETSCLYPFCPAHPIGDQGLTRPLTSFDLRNRSRIIRNRVAAKKKNPAAVALGRRGGKKGGPARAAKLTPEQRSESARNAVRARWAKVKKAASPKLVRRSSTGAGHSAGPGASDDAVRDLLRRIRAAKDPTEIQRMSGQLEKLIFHKQHRKA